MWISQMNKWQKIYTVTFFNDIYFERLLESRINCCDHGQNLCLLRSVAACRLTALCLHALSYWVDNIFDNKPWLQLTVFLYFFAQISRQIAKITVDSHQELFNLTLFSLFVLGKLNSHTYILAKVCFQFFKIFRRVLARDPKYLLLICIQFSKKLSKENGQ